VNIKFKIFIGLFLLCISLNAQNKTDSLYINVSLKFNKEDFKLNANYVSTQNDTLSFETVKFYLTGFQLEFKDQSTYTENNSYHLIDVENPETMQFSIANHINKEITSIKFKIGVDSLASVSGALEGDLDATKGMYWAWQSGLINFKIEGQSPSCKTRKNKFQFHVGGYLEPYYSMKSIEIPIIKSQIPNNKINLVLDLGKLFSEISLKETNTIMIPGKEAMKIADLTTKIFSIE
tara:strand:+ start:94246 stop:94950 length:705 start_codon:yes stop_codon:yes gene_type:complete